MNCNKTHGYTCLPNNELTELKEFCYLLPRIGITKGKEYRPTYYFIKYKSHFVHRLLKLNLIFT